MGDPAVPSPDAPPATILIIEHDEPSIAVEGPRHGEALSPPQLLLLAAEGEPGDPPILVSTLAVELNAVIDRSLAQLRDTDPERLLDAREVGRGRLPSTVLGLLVHAAEHSTRHMGQAITTARILSGA